MSGHIVNHPHRGTGRALIIVDVQPTFCEGGELPVPGGHRVAGAIATYLRTHYDRYDMVVTTQDYHIEPGDHFSTTPDYVNTWPVHGIAGSVNAELHPEIATTLEEFGGADFSVYKGQYAAAYSGFEGTDAAGTSLEQYLVRAGVGLVDVVGLAESHCVAETALDAAQLGFTVSVLTDLTAPVTPELGTTAWMRLHQAGVAARSSRDLDEHRTAKESP